ncbi:hypothetical protein AAG614_04365 [Citromicrobium bathyomarinum]|uniref:hypothetical protein n=1 Tax=Citromicrobium bathyomarinum TaxID=72174 RepID=UPI001E2FDD28|nr:hypothetical protein [Citromicrobium bathyomarinum]MCD1621310.1 hypothetical protein [Citromicrobium bathyomarinum]
MIGVGLLLAAGMTNPCPVQSSDFVPTEEVDRFFAERSVAIIAAAKRGDLESVSVAVSPDVKSVRQAHIGTSYDGPEGLITFVSWLEADSYVWRYQPYRAPSPATAYCAERQTEIEFIPADRSYGYLVTFTYRNGLLVHMTGASHELIEGSLMEVTNG